ncbi:uncharacterized protein LOC122958626 [Acropora millepora]|uniref:uncharacterized protein LOC122958626 n=1 Tax=Acropora millepora TaxID=45264 RepID=UPI001CF10883|nr:uncharacterized protein LOC122958626 [Acropora millepora]
MIDPSLVQQLGIQGKEGQLLLSTVSQRDKQKKGVKVDFQIAPVDNQDFEHITVRNAWAVRDLTISLEHVTRTQEAEQVVSFASYGPSPETKGSSPPIQQNTRKIPSSSPERRFNRVPGLEEKYRSVIDDYVARGYARQLSEREASKKSKLTKLLREEGFHPTKFPSDSRQVLVAPPQGEQANPSTNLDLNQLPVGRALGLHWDAASDTFQFKVVPTERPPTKRGILSTVSSLYDPLSFRGPFLLPLKVILQELCRIAVQWDDPMQEPLLTRWNKWVESLSLVANIKIPRCFKSFSPRAITDVQMHYFSNASNHGYAAVGYLRLVDVARNIHCAFVMGKTRNSPLRQGSIPRLELQAAVVATRRHLLLRKELDIPLHGVTFWSDSLTTLQYIANEKKRFKPFVANRVNEIHEASTPQQWRHEPTSLNPADDASRGLDLNALKSNCRWLSGSGP